LRYEVLSFGRAGILGLIPVVTGEMVVGFFIAQTLGL
jgi:hypothetical protein